LKNAHFSLIDSKELDENRIILDEDIEIPGVGVKIQDFRRSLYGCCPDNMTVVVDPKNKECKVTFTQLPEVKNIYACELY